MKTRITEYNQGQEFKNRNNIEYNKRNNRIY